MLWMLKTMKLIRVECVDEMCVVLQPCSNFD